MLATMTSRNQRPQGPNASPSAVSLPNFIVIKIPETVPAPHSSVALSLPGFLSVLPNLPNTPLSRERRNLGLV